MQPPRKKVARGKSTPAGTPGLATSPASPFWHSVGNTLWWRHYCPQAHSHFYKVGLPGCESNCTAPPETPLREPIVCSPDGVIGSGQVVWTEGQPACCSLKEDHCPFRRWALKRASVRVSNATEANCSPIPSGVLPEEGRNACAGLALFDLDGTLITTKSGKAFPQHSMDWQLLHAPHSTQRMKSLVSEGYHVIVISNQLGVQKGHTTLTSLTEKVDAIYGALGVPLTVCLATGDDLFRKPRPAAASFILTHLTAHLHRSQCCVSSSNCCTTVTANGVAQMLPGRKASLPPIFYVGDAAGRLNREPESVHVSKPKRKQRDHSTADLKFALNIGVPFFTPEQFFLQLDEPPPPLIAYYGADSIKGAATTGWVRPLTNSGSFSRRSVGSTQKCFAAPCGNSAKQQTILSSLVGARTGKVDCGRASDELQFFDPAELLSDTDTNRRLKQARFRQLRGVSHHQEDETLSPTASTGQGTENCQAVSSESGRGFLHTQLISPGNNKVSSGEQLPSSQEVVILVGAPGSGKSTLTETVFEGFCCIRQDELKTQQKCLKACKVALQEKRSVVVDMQNARKQTREPFIKLARDLSVPRVRCVVLKWPKELCKHMNTYRSLIGRYRKERLHAGVLSDQAGQGSSGREKLSTRFRTEAVPSFVIDSFYKQLEMPCAETEGLHDVVVYDDPRRHFIHEEDAFDDDDERELFFSFLD
ncbi:polynucleotide kinase-3 [Cystoisospora suis]|uniref:Polynucleotide kinase-3 n=1 Tax=Cystoisospora suis TaxID=483139 RepID=A0A2C6L2T5_9APIC|nr:polynucleotide kinase-3 [Cystoisospora suis]